MHDGQAKFAPPAVAVASVLESFEAQEHAVGVRLRDARSVVRDAQLDVPIEGLQADEDFRRGVSYRTALSSRLRTTRVSRSGSPHTRPADMPEVRMGTRAG